MCPLTTGSQQLRRGSTTNLTSEWCCTGAAHCVHVLSESTDGVQIRWCTVTGVVGSTPCVCVLSVCEGLPHAGRGPAMTCGTVPLTWAASMWDWPYIGCRKDLDESRMSMLRQGRRQDSKRCVQLQRLVSSGFPYLSAV